MEKEKKGIAIRFSKNQILEITKHSDPTKVDRITGQTLQVAKVLLPSSDYRDTHFGVDKNGIDRDARGAYINIPASYLKIDKFNEDRRYCFLNSERAYAVHFNGQKIGEQSGKTVYDKPESVNLSAEALSKAFKHKERQIEATQETSGEAASSTQKSDMKPKKKPKVKQTEQVR